MCIPYSDKHSVCITGANKYLLNLILEKLLPMLWGWRDKPAGYRIGYSIRCEMDLVGIGWRDAYGSMEVEIQESLL